MSARGRGTKPQKDEFYSTPAWAVNRLLDHLGVPMLQQVVTAVEPCAGDGAIVRATDAWFWDHGQACPIWTTHDIVDRNPGGRFSIRDIREPVLGRFDAYHIHGLCVTNPPFSMALDAAMFGVWCARTTCLLLRLNWLEAGGARTLARRAFLERHPPAVLVLPNRPAFVGGKTDATSYCWACWGPGTEAGTWRILANTPAEERCAPR
jgi:hypothetical protein